MSEPAPDSVVVAWRPRLVASVDDLKADRAERQRLFREVMEEGVHYGTIPGTERKNKDGEKEPNPTLYKPGAELLLRAYGLAAEITDAETVLDLAGMTTGTGEALVVFRKTCRIHPIDRPELTIAAAGGNATSWEKKYRYRDDSLHCPECQAAAILKSKDRPEFFCWAKRGGCGAKFRADDERITGQKVGRIPNPEIAEILNTLEKMADKRALLAATLIATGASDIFTQDVGDDQALDDNTYRQPVQDYEGPSTAHNDAEDGAPVDTRTTEEIFDNLPSASEQLKKEQPAATGTPSERQLDVLLSLARDQSNAKLNEVFTKALLSKRDETPQTVLDRLLAAHKEQHGESCIHVEVALKRWEEVPA